MRLSQIVSAVALCLLLTSYVWAQERDLINRQQGQRTLLGALVQATAATSDDEGVVIRRIDADSAADEAGLQEGDILLRLHGTRIKTPNELMTALSAYEPGETVYFGLVRDGTPRTVAVTLRGRGSSRANKRERGGANSELDRQSRSRDESELNQDWLDQHGSRTDARWRRDNPFQFGPNGDVRVSPEQADSQAFLGVAVELTGSDSKYNGAVIRRIQPNSPAERAGLRIGDILIRVGNARITEPEDLTDALSYYQAGDAVTFVIVRDDARHTISATLRERPSARPDSESARQGTPDRDREGRSLRGDDRARDEREYSTAIPDVRRSDSSVNNRGQDRSSARNNQDEPSAFLGVRLRDLTDAMKKDLKTGEGGALVAEVISGSPADQAGLRAGNIITAIDGRVIKNWRDACQAIEQAGGPGTELRFTVARGQETKELTATLGKSHLDLIVIFALPETDEAAARRRTYSKPVIRPSEANPSIQNQQPERY